MRSATASLSKLPTPTSLWAMSTGSYVRPQLLRRTAGPGADRRARVRHAEVAAVATPGQRLSAGQAHAERAERDVVEVAEIRGELVGALSVQVVDDGGLGHIEPEVEALPIAVDELIDPVVGIVVLGEPTDLRLRSLPCGGATHRAAHRLRDASVGS